MPFSIRIPKRIHGPEVYDVTSGKVCSLDEIDLPYFNVFRERLVDMRLNPNFTEKIKIEQTEEVTRDLYEKFLEMSDKDLLDYMENTPELQFESNATYFDKMGDFITDIQYFYLLQEELSLLKTYVLQCSLRSRWHELTEKDVDNLYSSYTEVCKMLKNLINKNEMYVKFQGIILKISLKLLQSNIVSNEPILNLKYSEESGYLAVSELTGNLTDEQMKIAFSLFKKETLGFYSEKMDELYQKVVCKNKFIYDFNNQKVVCVCPTLFSAFFSMTATNECNKRNYQKCDHPGCNKYFLVDTWHPQKRCSTHILPYQKKREKAKLKKYHKSKENTIAES